MGRAPPPPPSFTTPTRWACLSRTWTHHVTAATTTCPSRHPWRYGPLGNPRTSQPLQLLQVSPWLLLDASGHRGFYPYCAIFGTCSGVWCSLVLSGALWCSLVLFACSCASRSESTHRHTPNLQGKRLPANVFHRNTNSSSALIVPKLARDLACIQGLAQPSHLLFITSTLSPPAHLNAARWD